MGLKLWKHSQDRQTAEDYINVFHLAGLAIVRPVLFGPYKKKIVSINRKPAERQRRKAMDLKLCMHSHDRQAAENELSRF